MLDNQLHTAINHCISHHISFAAYRFPGCEPVFMADDGCSPLIDEKLFVINRWNTGSNANIILRNRLSAEAVLSLGEQSVTDAELPAATDRERYLSRVAALIEELKTTGGKTVIARTATGTLPQSPADCFAALIDAMPHNFCHIYYTSATGAWMGATPEVLLDAFDRKYTTMALAGTRPAGSEEPWDEKNTREQQMVTDFIVDNLRPLSSNTEVSNKITLPSGKIEHICTRIKGSLRPEVNVTEALDRLSPTPAVAGLPREISLSRIDSIEDFSRGCYSGYIAVIQGVTVSAYVNLRCLQFTADGRYCIYAGGGITAQSDPQSEWNETTAKINSILSILTSKSNE